MSFYGVNPLLRDPERDMSYIGTPRTAYVRDPVDSFHPHITHLNEEVVGVGATFQMGYDSGSCVAKQLTMTKSFGSVIQPNMRISPYEITSVLIPNEGYRPFKCKLIQQRPFSLLNIQNLEAIYAHYARRPVALEDPRIIVFNECLRKEEQVGADKRLINTLEGMVMSNPYLRRLCYDTLCWGTIESELSEICGRLRRLSFGRSVEENFGRSLANYITPLDVDPRITFPFSYDGASDPRHHWSPNEQLITLQSGPPFASSDQIVSTNATSIPNLRGFIASIESLPYTEFEIDVSADSVGNVFSIDPHALIDRYAHIRGSRTDWGIEISALFREHTFALVNALWNGLNIVRGVNQEFLSAQLLIKVMRNFHDEVCVHYFINGNEYPDYELYFDIALASLTSYGIAESYFSAEPHGGETGDAGWYGPTADMCI